MAQLSTDTFSFLGLNGLHVLITGAAGGIGGAAVEEFLLQGCRITALDRRHIDVSSMATPPNSSSRLHPVVADLTSEDSVASALASANAKFGPPNILIANAGITDESNRPSIWEMSTELWDKVNTTNVRGTFLTIKHFLLSAKAYQEAHHSELENLAIVVTGSETGKFGQEGHSEYASGKAGLQYGLVLTVKNEIVRLNSKARINAVAPGWVNTPLIGDRLDDMRELWAESQATVALKKIAQPSDVARAMAFLASHRAAGHISGECLSVDGGMEGRLIWKEPDIIRSSPSCAPQSALHPPGQSIIPASLPPPRRKRRMRICLSIDFDAISGYLGTGHMPQNTLSDYSAGIFSARVGVPRLLSLLKKHKLSSSITWFIPGHSMETFPQETEKIVASGAEIGLHGYSHEGAYAMTPAQERDVLEKCITLATALKGGKGKGPVGYRAPLYQIRESTVQLLQEYGFLYDSSMNAHDSLPYDLPHPFPSTLSLVPDYTKDASTWMVPTKIAPFSSLSRKERPTESSSSSEIHSPSEKKSLTEIPASWYTEDMTPLGFYPYSLNTQGYVSVDVVEKMWWDRFEHLWENECFVDDDSGNEDGVQQNERDEESSRVDNHGFGSIFPMVWHPESAGRAHIVGMIDRFIGKLVARAQEAREGQITFETMEKVARAWRAM